jgi:dTDP-4-amino-4,6-dideoxygalactose transaminase
VSAEEPIPLARPFLGEVEEERVLEVLRSGHLSLGPRLAEFEGAFASRLGVRHASAVSSGTAGLHLALRAVGVSDGAEVITSPFSFVASANVALYERARPVFADIDPVTLNISPDAAAAAVTERTAAILPVHVFGYPADIPALERLGLPIVEDACEALGAVHADGTAVGGGGAHPAVFGFYPNKQLTTGAGGIITTADPTLQERPRPAGVQLPIVGHCLRSGFGPALASRRDARGSRAGRGVLSGVAGEDRGTRASVRRCRGSPAGVVCVRRAAASGCRPRRDRPGPE